jgi:glycosyltransferase involved in cell wall biosynthesis
VGLVKEVVVVNNNSTDATVEKALSAGATVIHEPNRGYGYACQRGLDYLDSCRIKPDILVFLDGDYSDYPEEMAALLKPILEQGFDMVIGSRLRGMKDRQSMPIHQRIGNRLFTLLINRLYGVNFTDLGPFRAIRYDKISLLAIRDRTYGWTAEMQLKAVKLKLRVTEIPVSYRPRIGKSKISGTFKGTVLASYKILTAIFGNL